MEDFEPNRVLGEDLLPAYVLEQGGLRYYWKRSSFNIGETPLGKQRMDYEKGSMTFSQIKKRMSWNRRNKEWDPFFKWLLSKTPEEYEQWRIMCKLGGYCDKGV